MDKTKDEGEGCPQRHTDKSCLFTAGKCHPNCFCVERRRQPIGTDPRKVQR